MASFKSVPSCSALANDLNAKTWRKHGIIFGEIPLIEKHPFFNLILFLSTSNQPLHINGLEKTPRPLNKILEKDLFDSHEHLDSLKLLRECF